jgi:putative ATP-dependent endonuclease of OLD family
LKDVLIDFENVTTFIGPNGVGKSTVLRALDWFFNGSKNGDLCDEDCTNGDSSQTIRVEVQFTGLTAEDRVELGAYVPAASDTFVAWKSRTPDGSEYLSANAKGYELFTPIKAPGLAATAKKDLFKILRTEHPELGLPAASTGGAVDTAIREWESANVDKLTELPETLQTNFFGFNSVGKMSGLFDFVLITADLRASEESSDVKTSIIGRILERTIDRTSADSQIAEIVEQSRIAQQKIYTKSFREPLEKMTGRLNSVVSTYSPGRTLKVTPAEVELKAPRTTFNVSILDGTLETAVERQGHGFQRTLLISSLQMLAEHGAASANGMIFLAIEEPELYQHPVQAQAFAKVLRDLAEDDSKNIQVAYATHSPMFIEAQKFSQVRRLTRSIGGNGDVSVYASCLDNVKTMLIGIVKPATVDSQLDGTVSARLPLAMFANAVILVEGTTEVAVFEGIADRTQVGNLAVRGAAVVEVGGKSSIPLAHAILTSLGIPVYAIFDGDDGFEARAVKNGKDAVKIQEERVGHVSANRKLLKYFGLPEVDFPAQQVTDGVAILGDHLESLFAAEWPEWEVACKALESQSSVSLRKNQVGYRTATMRATGTPPEILTKVIDQGLILAGKL